MSTVTPHKPFVPTLFSKVAHYPKDLMKKKFDYEHSLKVLSRNSPSGLKFETAAISTDAGAIRGYVKTSLPRFSFGTVSTELYNDGLNDNKVSLDVTGLPKGLSLVPTLSGNAKTTKLPLLGLEATYKQDYFAGHATYKTDFSKHTIDTSASYGQALGIGSGLSLAATASLDVSNGVDLNEYNFALEFEQRDATFSYATEKNASIMAFSVFQRLTPDHVLGAVLKSSLWGGNNNDRTLTIGSEYRYSPDTTLKAKIDVPSGVLNTHVETRLTNPNVLVGIASSYTLGKLSSDRVGLSFALGDF